MKSMIRKRAGWIAGLLVFVVVLGVFLSQAAVWASDQSSSYQIKLDEPIDSIKITLENQSDPEIREEAETNKYGTALFNQIETVAGGDYILTIGSMESYYVETVTVTDLSAGSDEILSVTRDEDGSCQCTIKDINEDQKVKVQVTKKKEQPLSHLIIEGLIEFGTEDGSTPKFADGAELMTKEQYITSSPLKITGKDAVRIGYKSDKGDRVYKKDSYFILEESTVLKELYIESKEGTWIEYALKPTALIVIDTKSPVVSLKGEDVRWISEKKKTIDIQFTAEDISEEDGIPCAGLNETGIKIYMGDETREVAHEKCEEENTYQFSVSWDEIDGAEVTYQIFAKDKLDNDGKCLVTVKKDIILPEITDIKMETEEGGEIEYAEEATKSWKPITLTVTAADADSGVDTIGLQMKGDKILTKDVDKNNSATFEWGSSAKMQEIEGIVCTDKARNKKEYKNISDISEEIKSNNVLIKETSVDFSYQIQGEAGQVYSMPDQKKKTIAVSSPEGKNLQVDAKETEDPPMGFRTLKIKYGNYDQEANEESLQEVLDNLELKKGDNEIEVTAKMQGGQNIKGSIIIRYDTEVPDIKEIRVADPSDSAKDIDNRYVFQKFGTFYNGGTKIVVRAEDNAGVRDIQLFVNGTAYGEPVAATDGKAEFVVPKEIIQQGVQKEYLSGSISAVATDQVGNKSNEKKAYEVDSNLGAGQFMIENVPPEITCTVPEAAYGGVWYGSDIDFSVDIRDLNSGLYHVKAVLNGKTVKEVTSESTYGNQKTDTETFTINTSEAERAEDGSYILDLTVEDNAGNKSTVSRKIYVDSQKPGIVSFEFDAAGYNEGKKTDFGVSEQDYGYYFREKTKVTIRAKDDLPSSGLKSITYYTVDKDKKKSEEKTEEVSSSGSITFVIPANFKGQVYAKPTDHVNHTTDDYVTPDSTVIESRSQHKEDSDISFTRPKPENKDKKGQELYKKDVTITIKAADRYSGIRKVEYSVEAPYDTKNNLKGEIEFDNNGKKKEGSASGWEQTGKEKNLVTELTGKVKVTNNSNDIVVKVKMTDRAGHVTTNKDTFSIDKTDPVIQISYDNNKDDKDFNDFYKEERTATVVITERNFDAEDVEYRVANKDGDVPQTDLAAIGAWTKKTDKKDPDQTTYTARIPFSQDGMYTWNIAFTDMAGNKAETVEKQEYTIDQTAPVITVSYDNEKASNGYYYNENRTATITIEEHNFEESRIKIEGKGSNDGKKVAFPEVMGWSSVGDSHTATILYVQDAEYSFQISYTDKAGNKAEAPAEDHFVIDQTRPQLTITGVENESAYKDEVAPVVSYQDVNLDPSTLHITLKGANRGETKGQGETREIKNGAEFKFDEFEEKKEIDDIYTLRASVKDRAGNESERTVIFSVNRFGSTYQFEIEPLASITEGTKKGEYRYVQEEFDVVLKEINVDELKEEETKIRMLKNGDLTELQKGSDYEVSPPSKKKGWSEYTYTIFRGKFAEDGNYEVEVRSVDKAKNTNENTDKEKKAEIKFAVDKTAPKILPGDLENDTQYPLESKEVKFSIDDNLKLSEVKMYLNDNEVSYKNEDEDYTITIPSANVKQSFRIVARDAAGNEKTEDIDGFLVSTNLFVRWYNNLPLFAGTLAGLGILIVLMILFIILRRIKKKEVAQ